ncbi:hypothetical protein [Desulfobacter vibrioformis]|uniref:hypothetical protein n=1 Tax=Desulfobacter vibrioformis TaxID=34031 RepID=UPI00068CA764|nr:hypothetical protein [Desulfobacter vibrioformis]
MNYMKEIEAEKAHRKECSGKEYAAGGVFIFFDDEYQGWMNELRDPQKWVPGCVAVSDDSGRIWKAVGGNNEDGAETWQEVKSCFQRGGVRPGAGRKPMNPELKKQKKAFSLSYESVHALVALQESLGLSSQSAVVEYLALRGYREFSSQGVIVEHQRKLF